MSLPTLARPTETTVPSPRPEPTPHALGPDDFRDAFRHHPGGVALVTALGKHAPAALTATSLTSISADPAVLAFSVSHASSAAPTILAAGTVVVHLLDASTVHLAKLGATSGIDRFADTSLWTTLPTGEPVFRNTRWLRARVLDRVTAGAATLVLAEPLECDLGSDPEDGCVREGLVYLNRTWHRLGDASRLD
ncbi:MAG: flavin reductase family protein [Actinobacteria bacterium]|jgi:flavin reductase (DIM6/NTAB) family NADH-FMN oxidoreductase RutF|nr:flavin reductase family protein [Actinomycetota bacterium]